QRARRQPSHPRRTPHLVSAPPPRPPACAPGLPTLGRAAPRLEAERATLRAAADYAAANELPLPAMLIPAAMASFLALRGHFARAIALHQTAMAGARRAGDRPGQARARTRLPAPPPPTRARPPAPATP